MLGYIYRLFTEPGALDTKRVTACMAKYRKGKGHQFIIPNVYIHKSYEIDVFSAKRNDLFDDEVKISRPDYFKDLKKGKHKLIERGSYPANFFSYVCPEGLISVKEVPKYAGLYWVMGNGSVRVKKLPRRINRKSQLDKYMFKIAVKLDKLRTA